MALACLAVLATVPTASAAPVCSPTPLGPPAGDGGLDDLAKEHGNAIIYNGCSLAIGTVGSTASFVSDQFDAVCDFALGHPCIKSEQWD